MEYFFLNSNVSSQYIEIKELLIIYFAAHFVVQGSVSLLKRFGLNSLNLFNNFVKM